jgi:serine/threonine-protein kinase
MALPSRATGPADAELQTVLQRRLRVFVLIVCGAAAVFLIKVCVTGLQAGFSGQGTLLAVQTVLLTASIICTSLLWSGPPRTLWMLRCIEIIIVTLTVLLFVSLVVSPENGWPVVAADASPNGMLGRLAAEGLLLPWVGLLVAYGTLIPNTWRRCVVVVTLVALAPLAVAVVFDVRHGGIPRPREVFSDMAIHLAIAVAIATYGSYRIEELRQEVSQVRTLGPYHLKKQLGVGGMGEVYLAEHVLLRRLCAVKLIRAERAGDPKVLLRFQREVQATATLTHWNTVEIYDYGHAEDGTFYYAMEYLPGLTLQELVERHGTLSPERAIYLLRQICLALHEAHAIGLLHRDIKPSNIMVCERGKVYDVAKLLDFGLVREHGLNQEVDKLTMVGTVAGSPAYMSPEQALAKNDLDARSDIYSLGAVAYYLLTGQPPFVHASPVQVLMAHVYEPVLRPSAHRGDIPADVQEVVLRCLEKKPAQRYSDADSLEQALGRCACAGRWDRQKAAAWWETHVGIESANREGLQPDPGPADATLMTRSGKPS